MSEDEPLPLTFRHWAGVSPYTSPFGFAETCVFGKQSPEPVHCGPQGLPSSEWTVPSGHPFSRSYRASLSNSLTRVLSFTSGHLPLPTCVGLRYGHQDPYRRGFSRRQRINEIPQGGSPRVFSLLGSRGGFAYPGRRLQGRTHHVRWARSVYLSVSPLRIAGNRWCRNFDLLSIAFASALRLRTDLPYADQHCVGNLRLPVSWILTRIVATHAGILTCQRSTLAHAESFAALTTLPYLPPDGVRRDRGFGGVLSPVTFSAQDSLTSEQLRTL